MTKKKLTLVALALTLVLCLLPTTALAQQYTLNDNDIVKIYNDGETQYVKLNEEEDVAQTDETVITTNGDPTKAVVKLMYTDKGGTVRVTLKNAIIINNGTAMDVENGVKAEVTLEGENVLANYPTSPETRKEAALHIAEGDLTIKSGEQNDAPLDTSLIVYSINSNGADIGSDNGEKCAANIRITDEAKVIAISLGEAFGANIGSGSAGEFTGKIVVDGNAAVIAASTGITPGAQLGSGAAGAFNGKVVIKDDAVVLVENAIANGGVIGQGYSFDVLTEEKIESNGSISLEDNASILLIDENVQLGGYDVDTETGVQVKIEDGVEFFDVSNGKKINPNSRRIKINGEKVEEEPAPTATAVTYYTVVDASGNAVAYDETLEDGVLTISAENGAALKGTLENLQLLDRKGVTTLCFGASTLDIAELFHGVGMQEDEVVLTAAGSLNIGGVDYTALIK